MDERRPTRLQRIRATGREYIPPYGGDAPILAEPTVPEVTLALVEWLERTIPDVSPPTTMPYEEMLVRAAKVELVRRIRAEYTRQEAAKRAINEELSRS